MDVSLILDIVSLVFLVITSAFMVLLTFLILSFSAKPKLKVSLKEGRKKLEFVKGEKKAIRFHIENAGHWYAKPAATNVTLYVNFEQPLEPVKIRYGSTLEKEDQNVLLGKDNSKYLKATGIFLFHEEPGEDVEVQVVAPSKKRGQHRIWIAAYSDEGSCGVHTFCLEVVDEKRENSDMEHRGFSGC